MNLEDAKAKLMARLPAMRAAALGQSFGIRQNPKQFVRGVITDVQFGYWTQGPTDLAMVFKITMECGAAKVSREFHCRTLPQ